MRKLRYLDTKSISNNFITVDSIYKKTTNYEPNTGILNLGKYFSILGILLGGKAPNLELTLLKTFLSLSVPVHTK